MDSPWPAAVKYASSDGGEAAAQRSMALSSFPSLQALARPDRRLNWLAALLVAVLIAGGMEAAAAGTRFVQVALAAGAEPAPDSEDRLNIARLETQIGATKPAPKAAPEFAPDAPAAALLRATCLQSSATAGRHLTGETAAILDDLYLPAQSRGPPSAPSFD